MSHNREAKLTKSNAIVYSLSSMIGIGIFMKTNTLSMLSGGRITPVIILFLCFLVGIFCFCHVLEKIISKQTGDMGIIEWSKDFCPEWLHMRFCNFIRFFYHPISLYIFSMYAVMKFAHSTDLGFITISFLAFVLVCVVMCLNFISFEWSVKVQKILWKFVLMLVIIIPFLGLFGSAPEAQNIQSKKTGGWSVLFTGLPALLFIYDGFYNVTSLRSKLKKSQNLKKIVTNSIVIVTAIYMYVLIGFHIGDPKTGDYRNFWFFHKYPGFLSLFEIFIGLAAVLTLNSIAISNMPQLLKMYKVHKFEDESWFQKTVFYKQKNIKNDVENKLSLWIYLMIKTTIFFIFMVMLMAITKYNKNEDVYGFLNILSDSVSLFIFIIITGIIISSHRTSEIVKDRKYTLCTYIACGFIIATILFMKTNNLIGIGFFGKNFGWYVIKLSTLIVFSLGCCVDIIFNWIAGYKNRNNILYPKKSGRKYVITIN